MLASVTRLRVRSVRHLLAFAWQTFLTQRRVARATGFIGGRLLIDVHRTFWTLTVWESEMDMKAFRGSGPHAQVMPRLAEWCDEASYGHWNWNSNLNSIPSDSSAPTSSAPTWPEAYEHLVGEGRLSRVAHPSRDHEARHFPAPRLKPLIGLDLKPVRPNRG